MTTVHLASTPDAGHSAGPDTRILLLILTGGRTAPFNLLGGHCPQLTTPHMHVDPIFLSLLCHIPVDIAALTTAYSCHCFPLFVYCPS